MKEENITNYFESDHDRLDRMFEKFRELKQSDLIRAKDCFNEFRSGLQRHILWEEKVLFPMFEQKTGIMMGPTRVMRMEHEQIQADLEAIHKKLEALNFQTEAEEQSLLAVLSAHNLKEEKILYPAIDRSINDTDRAAIFEAIKQI